LKYLIDVVGLHAVQDHAGRGLALINMHLGVATNVEALPIDRLTLVGLLDRDINTTGTDTGLTGDDLTVYRSLIRGQGVSG
jgi:hypothetical protein